MGKAAGRRSRYLSSVSTFEERRRARRAWPIRSVPLGHEELVDDRDESSVDERLALVWTLTRQLWAFTRRPFPAYSRSETPGTIIRGR
jgi:hypothetical protein